MESRSRLGVQSTKIAWIFLVFVGIGIGGCALYDKELIPVVNPITGEAPPTIEETITTVGTVLTPITGGLSAIVAALGVTALKLYRQSRGLGDAVREIHDGSGTPAAETMVKTDRAKAAVRKVLVNS